MADDILYFSYGKIRFNSLNEKLDYFEKKAHLVEAKHHMVKDLDGLNMPAALNYQQTLKCVTFLTKSYLVPYYLPFEKRLRIDSVCSQLIYRLCSNLPFLDENDPKLNWKDGLDKGIRKPENIADYWKNMEHLVEEIDAQPNNAKKKDQLFQLAYSLRDIAQQAPFDSTLNLPYDGKILKKSDTVGNHNRSIVVLPTDSQNAITALYNDEVRTLFAEYDEKGSAETTVNEYYGTDGAYAAHYRQLLDCRQRYPQQKSLIFG